MEYPGFIGGAYLLDSVAADLQRCVNFCPEPNEGGYGRSPMILRGAPGLSELLRLLSVAIVGGGTGYTVNDILTVAGGTGTAATLKVTSVAAGVIDGISVQSSGAYTVDPTDPVSVTGGTGNDDATFTLNWATVVMANFYETQSKRIFSVARLENSTIRLFENTLAGVQTDRGQLSASLGTLQPASISSNELQLFIVVPEVLSAFIFTLATNVLTDVTASVGNTNPLWGQFLDQYFIALCDDGQIYISALLDGTTWDALDTAKAESSPDKTVMIIADHGEIRQFGAESLETWYNSGAADFPFEPIRGATVPQGILHRYSAVSLAGKLYWVGRGREGREQVWKAAGYRPDRISTYAIEEILQTKAVAGAIPVAFGYQEAGHPFLVITYPDDKLTLVYDGSTKIWHERMYLNGSTEEAIRARCHCFAGAEDGASGAHLVGDRANGKIYKMGLSFLDDAGNTIRRIRRAPHIHGNGKRVFYQWIEVGLEVGLAANQRLNMRYSDTAGKTYESYKTVNVGPTVSTVGVTAAVIVAGGTGYTVNDVLTIVGGDGTAATLTATTVVAGVITAVSVTTAGAYTGNPANPVSVTGGTGTGATFTLSIPSLQLARARWPFQGSARDRVYELMVEDSVRWILNDAQLGATAGAH